MTPKGRWMCLYEVYGANMSGCWYGSHLFLLAQTLPPKPPTMHLHATTHNHSSTNAQTRALSCVLIFTHWYFVHLRKNAFKLVALLSFCIAGSDLTALMFIRGGSCNWYSFLTTFFVLAGVLWSMVLSRTVALVLNRDNLSSRLNRLTSYAAVSGGPCRKWFAKNVEGVRMFAFHTLVWGTAAVCSLSMTIQADAQPSISSWCWFDSAVSATDTTDTASTTVSDNTGTSPDIAQVLLFFIPIGISILYNCKTLFWASFKKTCGMLCSERWRDVALIGHETNENVLQQHVDELIRKLRYYIMLSVVVSAWLCIAEIVNFNDPSRKNIVWSYSVLLVLLRLHGFGNLIIYLGRRDVRVAWHKALWGFMGWELPESDPNQDKVCVKCTDSKKRTYALFASPPPVCLSICMYT